MEKIYGATGREDGLFRIGRNKWELIYGYGTDGERGWNWRQRWKGRKPTAEETRAAITEHVNKEVDAKILGGMTWDGQTVWLSMENQMNYKTAYDLAMQSGGQNLPVTFKLGTEEGPVYKTFDSVAELGRFYKAVAGHIQNALEAGWKEKDGIDWDKFEVSEE